MVAFVRWLRNGHLNEYLGTICAVEGKEVDALRAQRVMKQITFFKQTWEPF